MDLQRAKEQIEKLKEESQANKDHMIQVPGILRLVFMLQCFDYLL